MILDFKQTRELFDLPEGVIYLDGNSLGPLPKAALAKTQSVMTEQWGKLLITGWNKAGWMQQPIELGNRIGRLIGAARGHVVVGDTLSIKVYQALAAALELRPERKVILSDTGNFPSDLYMAEGLVKTLAKGHELRVVSPETLKDHINEEVAVTLLTEADYRTGRLHNMSEITELAHACGALTLWDLAHTAGAIEVDLQKAKADFAVGCTYKYLNAGPGAPGFIYVAPQHANIAQPVLAGWLGHAAPFEFETSYRSGPAIERMRVGTPAVIASATLDAALEIWDQVDMKQVRKKSIALSELFIKCVEETCPMLTLASPRNPEARGSQVSFVFEHGYAAMQALIASGVIGDFRAPDIMRFGFTPLYVTENDVLNACKIFSEVMNERRWDRSDFKVKALVT